MKIVVTGTSALIAASPASGVDTITGLGMAEALLEDHPGGLRPNAAYSRIGRYVP